MGERIHWGVNFAVNFLFSFFLKLLIRSPLIIQRFKDVSFNKELHKELYLTGQKNVVKWREGLSPDLEERVLISLSIIFAMSQQYKCEIKYIAIHLFF